MLHKSPVAPKLETAETENLLQAQELALGLARGKLVITKERKEEILSLIKEMEATLVANGDKTDSIAAICQVETSKSEALLASTDPIAPVLRTALVINWREATMKSRYERFRKLFPHINDLYGLKAVLDSTGAMEFCTVYLNINPNPQKPDANPKYALLKTLTNGFLEYKKLINASSDIDALRHWALNLKMSNLRSDFIGKRKGVGFGVVENIRINLGYSVVKPDRHVIGVMKQCLGINIESESYIQFSKSIGINPRYLDCVLFEYGKLKGISGECALTSPSMGHRRRTGAAN